jgi:uncharacterized coiled-coil DUF342 family protein
LKDATIIRNLKREAKERHQDLSRVLIERDRYRERATKAEQEAAEWKRRFDALLAKPWARVEEPGQ